MTGYRSKNKFHPTLTGLVAVALLAVVATTTVSAQTALQPAIALRPLTPDDVTKYKLPTGTQLSAGLNTIGLGQPAYLEAQVNIAYAAADITGVSWTLTSKPGGSQASLSDGPLGPTVPAFEPADRTVVSVAGRTLLKPDVVGPYVVTASIATRTGTVNIAQTIIGAKYVGIQACQVCHSGGMAKVKTPTWQKTLHAEMFKDGLNGAASDHYSAACLSCHTVGFDATAPNGGFNDVAKQLAWTFPTSLKPGTFDAIPDALKNLGNIQCENCHGPGSQHVKYGGTTLEISVGKNSGVCGQCHQSGTHHIKESEWLNSRHAVVTRDPSGAGREACVGCHTGTGFIDKVQGAATPRTAYSAVNCQSCHESHGDTTPASAAHQVRKLTSVTLADGTVIKGGGTGLLCMNCHQSRQNAATYAATTAANSHFGPHHGPQADMLAGANAYTYGLKIPSSAHQWAADETCATCHMQTVASPDPALFQAGGHTFKMSYLDAKNVKHDLVAACQGCHGPEIASFDFPLFDYDGDGKIDGVQTEVQHLLDQLSALLPPLGQPKTALTMDSTWTRGQLEAGYNWEFVAEDKSKGVHNTAYAVGLLKASIADLSKK